MQVQHRKDNSKGTFYIEIDGQQLAEMEYSLAAGDGFMIVSHTEVNDALRGQGAGMKMLLALVEHARGNNIKVMPLCPFAKSVFDKREDLRDVLK